MNPPEHLPEIVKAAWIEIDAQLPAPLETADMPSFESLCRSLVLVRQAGDALAAEGFVIEHGDGRVSMHPAGRLLSSADASLARWCRYFGLHPSARQALKIEKPKPANPMAKFFEPKLIPKPKAKKAKPA